MKWLTKHVGLATSVGEFQFKHWIDNHASEVLADIGVEVGKTVLDFGCGSGIYTISAAKLVGSDGRVYALDVSTESLDRIETIAKQEGLKNIFRIDAPPEVSAPLEDETIDIMLMIDVLQEIENRETLFDEAYRILKPGGEIAIYPMHIGEEEVEKLAKSSGLDLLEKRFRDHIFIFRKPF